MFRFSWVGDKQNSLSFCCEGRLWKFTGWDFCENLNKICQTEEPLKKFRLPFSQNLNLPLILKLDYFRVARIANLFPFSMIKDFPLLCKFQIIRSYFSTLSISIPKKFFLRHFLLCIHWYIAPWFVFLCLFSSLSTISFPQTWFCVLLLLLYSSSSVWS